MSVSDEDHLELLTDLLRSTSITEAMLLSTCNRVEVYLVADAGDGAAAHAVDVLARHAGVRPAALARGGFIERDLAAVRHLFEVASGLDSLVVGDEQVLGQVRSAYGASTAANAAGPVLHALAQRALRVGKQVRTDTDLAGTGATVVGAVLDRAAAALPGSSLVGRRAVVLGAGAMGSLAVSHLRRRKAGEVLVANRTPSRASQLAQSTGSPAVRSVPVEEVVAVLRTVDLLVACTASPGALMGVVQLRAATSGRDGDRAPLVVCDVGVPRNVHPAVGLLPGVVLLDLESLRQDRWARTGVGDVASARLIVSAHLDAYAADRRAAGAAPAVIALREKVASVVRAELTHLDRRLPDLDPETREEVARTVRRLADKLLHAPTLALKQAVLHGEGEIPRGTREHLGRAVS